MTFLKIFKVLCLVVILFPFQKSVGGRFSHDNTTTRSSDKIPRVKQSSGHHKSHKKKKSSKRKKTTRHHHHHHVCRIDRTNTNHGDRELLRDWQHNLRTASRLKQFLLEKLGGGHLGHTITRHCGEWERGRGCFLIPDDSLKSSLEDGIENVVQNCLLKIYRDRRTAVNIKSLTVVITIPNGGQARSYIGRNGDGHYTNNVRMAFGLEGQDGSHLKTAIPI